MNKEKLEILFQTLQTIRSSRNNLEFEANHYLTISKPTPESLAVYNHNSPRFEVLTEFNNLIFQSLKTFFAFFKIPLSLKIQKAAPTQRPQSIFVSHYFSNLQKQSQIQDKFFGLLPEISQELGITSKILFIDQETDNFESRSISSLSGETYSIIGITRFDLDYIHLFFKNFFLSVWIFKSGLKVQNSYCRSIHLRAAVKQVSKGTFRNLILANEIISEIKSSDVEEIWLTLEGHAYERTIISSISNEKLDVKINLYQHAAIVPHQKGVFDLLNEYGDRVNVFTSGEVTYNYFRFHFPWLAENIKIAGSDKALQNEPIKSLPELKNREFLLFLPEGTTESTLSMVFLALECMNLKNSIPILFRFHPNTPQSALEISYKQLANTEIVISSSGLVDDFKRAFACVYRSSATVIQSLMFGVLPVYFAPEGDWDLDCLALSKLNYPKIHSSSELIKLLSSEISETPNDLFSASEDFLTFSRSYFMPWVRRSL